jgi:hypothetical protein
MMVDKIEAVYHFSKIIPLNNILIDTHFTKLNVGSNFTKLNVG